jgi:putative flippase GtrA
MLCTLRTGGVQTITAPASSQAGRRSAARLWLSARARVLRFALVGSTCGLIQLGLLHVLVEAEVQANLANLAAFAISAQVNFILSQFFTWRDRWAPSLGRPGLISRLFLFNGSVATTGVVNQSVFGLANLFIWYLPAAALGIAVAAVTNFLLNDRIVFRLANSQRIAVNPHG